MDESFAEKRIGVLVVAYNAASTLAKVLDRIPTELRPEIEEVIVSDDHSQDSTYLVGLGYQQQSDLPITLIRQTDEPWVTAATRRPATTWRSSTGSTSWSCSTATASMRPSPCPTSSPLCWPTRPTRSSDRAP